MNAKAPYSTAGPREAVSSEPLRRIFGRAVIFFGCDSCFARGEVFSLATVRHLRGFAAGLLLASCAGVVVPTLIVLMLTLEAAGGRVLTVSLASQQLLMLLFSGIVWQMGHAMTRAVELAEDNAQII